MMNRNRAWRRRHKARIVNKVKETHAWVTEQIGKTKTAAKNASTGPGQLQQKAKKKVADQAQALRESWRMSQEISEAFQGP